MRILLLAVTLSLLTTPVLANPIGDPPIKGTYMLSCIDGYYSESWNTSGYYLEIGNTLNLFVNGVHDNENLYWDTENGLLTISCSSISQTPTFVSDTRDPTGTGTVTYSVNYSGGTFRLSKEGPWSSDQLFDFPGYFTSCYLTTDLGYYNGELITINGIMSATGRFDWMSLCLVLELQMFSMYNTNDGPLPPEYPEFLDPSCQTGTRAEGGYGGLGNSILTLSNCSVPSEEVTWGKIKQLYNQ